jgi:hypothetical protein
MDTEPVNETATNRSFDYATTWADIEAAFAAGPGHAKLSPKAGMASFE